MMSLLAQKLRPNEPLAKYTAARIGGAAEWLYLADETLDDLSEVVLSAWQAGMPVRILGGGANVLIADSGARGLVVINRVSSMNIGDRHIRAASGVSLTRLAHKCAALGFSGFEWAVSVPGSIGGAVVNNAGAHGGEMAGNVREVTIIDALHGWQTLTLADLNYDYRASSLKQRADRRFLVLDALLEFASDDSAAIQARMDANIAQRKRTQPPGASLGSIFKNPPGDYAGRLIEAAGLKGFQIGGAMVSPIHANFFINTGDASASDYYALIQHVRRAVEQRFGTVLELEIELVGEWF